MKIIRSAKEAVETDWLSSSKSETISRREELWANSLVGSARETLGKIATIESNTLKGDFTVVIKEKITTERGELEKIVASFTELDEDSAKKISELSSSLFRAIKGAKGEEIFTTVSPAVFKKGIEIKPDWELSTTPVPYPLQALIGRLVREDELLYLSRDDRERAFEFSPFDIAGMAKQLSEIASHISGIEDQVLLARRLLAFIDRISRGTDPERGHVPLSTLTGLGKDCPIDIQKLIIYCHNRYDMGLRLYMYAEIMTEEYKDLIVSKYKGKTIITSLGEKYRPGGLIYEAQALRIHWLDLWNALYGMVELGLAKKVDDCTYLVLKRARATESLENIPEENKNGDCYQQAWKLFFNSTDKSPLLVHGIVAGRGKLEGILYNHAWVEMNNKVYDKTMPLAANGIAKEVFYSLGNIDDKYSGTEGLLFKYTKEEALKRATKYSTYGPWEDSLWKFD